MRKNMKAIFIVSILFIICVGLFGLMNGNHRFGKENAKYKSMTEESGKADEISDSKEIADETMEAQTADAKDESVGQERDEAKSMQSKVSSEAPLEDSKIAPSSGDGTKENELFATNQAIAGKSEKTEKEQYIERLNTITTYYDDLWSRTESFTMVDMKELKNQEYTKWDDELNTIYQLVKKKLPEEDFISLRDEEREWINKRDEQAALAGSKYAGGSMESLEYMSVMTELTKERTYELVDIYFEE